MSKDLGVTSRHSDKAAAALQSEMAQAKSLIIAFRRSWGPEPLTLSEDPFDAPSSIPLPELCCFFFFFFFASRWHCGGGRDGEERERERMGGGGEGEGEGFVEDDGGGKEGVEEREGEEEEEESLCLCDLHRDICRFCQWVAGWVD